MNTQSFFRASPWIVVGSLIGAGASCGADVTDSGNNTSPLPSSGAPGAGRAGVGGASGGGSGLGGATTKASGGAAASTTTGGGTATTGGVSGGASGGVIGVSGGVSSTTGGVSASGSGGVGVAGGMPGASGSGTGGGCSAGQALCSGTCIDVQTDPLNCGECVKACDVGRPCVGGVCQCPDGQTLCNGVCADVKNDQANCGTCGTKCMDGTPCNNGMCTQGGSCTNDSQTYNGHITWYVLATEMVGCHYPTSSLPQHYGAMNTADYLAGAVCGACVEITNQQNGRKLEVVIADECPEESNKQWCFTGSHHIDLIQPAYNALGANNNPAITWKYVPCSPQGGIKYFFDKAAKQGYLAVTPMNHRHRIAKMEVLSPSGTWIELKRSYYDMWESTAQLGPGPYSFRVTDIYGHMIQDNGIELKPAQVVNGVGQFEACQ